MSRLPPPRAIGQTAVEDAARARGDHDLSRQLTDLLRRLEPAQEIEVELTTDEAAIAHRLGVVPRTYMVTPLDNAVAWCETSRADRRFVYLKAASAVTVRLTLYR